VLRNRAGGSLKSASGPEPASSWLKVIRHGSLFTGYVSADGSSWTQIGSTTPTMSRDDAWGGLVVTSHDPRVLNTSTFDHVEFWVPESMRPSIPMISGFHSAYPGASVRTFQTASGVARMLETVMYSFIRGMLARRGHAWNAPVAGSARLVS
jgi:hypothetical protein